MRNFAALGLLVAAVVVSPGQQQQQEPGHRRLGSLAPGHENTSKQPAASHPPAAPVVDKVPVTASEARATFAKAETVMRTTFKLPAANGSSAIPAGASPVRREQVVAEMARLVGVIQPKFKLTPRAVRYDPKVLKMAAPQFANLNRLISMGAVARIGPVAVGPTNSLTIAEFGDAVGFFMARMAELTHQPSGKWTPWLRDEEK